MLQGVRIRPLAADDAAVVAALAGELGYEIPGEVVAEQIAGFGDDATGFVATAGVEAVGWIHVYRTDLLQAAPFAEIGGLVVTATMRGAGIGRALIRAAETWAIDHGLIEVRLRSRVAREGAHRFYERLGYEVEKTSFTFRRTLSDHS